MRHRDYLNRLIELLGKCILSLRDGSLLDWEEGFEQMIATFSHAKQHRKNVFFIGNGGSAAIAEHMSTDFLKNGGIRAINLMNPALITCLGNDFGYEHVYAKSLSLLVEKDDLLVTISSSGSSPNIIEAICTAREKKAKTITFSGFQADNQARQLGDCNLYVPASHYGMVESIHTLLLQQIVDTIMERDGRML